MRGLNESLRSVLRGYLLEDDAGDPPKTLKVSETDGKKALDYLYGGFFDGMKFPPDKIMSMIGNGDVERGKQMFVANFDKLSAITKRGKNKPPRSWMPVIQPNDIPQLISRLKSGDIDIVIPHADIKAVGAEVPRSSGGRSSSSLHGEAYDPSAIDVSKGKGAPKPVPDPKTFLIKGKLDKDTSDDIVRGIKVAEIPVSQLLPSQDEVYGSKIAVNMAKFGPTVGGTTAFGKPDIIVTADNYILDGHHRWATAFAGHPKNKIKVTVIPLEFKHLYLILRAYGAAVGNKQQA